MLLLEETNEVLLVVGQDKTNEVLIVEGVEAN